MLSAGPQRGQATSPNAKIIKHLKTKMMFYKFDAIFCGIL
jgi:malate/lactate dehydrogenase